MPPTRSKVIIKEEVIDANGTTLQSTPPPVTNKQEIVDTVTFLIIANVNSQPTINPSQPINQEIESNSVTEPQLFAAGNLGTFWNGDEDCQCAGCCGDDEEIEMKSKESPNMSDASVQLAPSYNSSGTHQCSYCPKSFSNLSDLRSHTVVHIRFKRFNCNVCGQVFSHWQAHSDHKKIHDRTYIEKLYQCDQCDKAFTRQGNLKVHMRTHTKEKPYRCDLCDKLFSHTCALTNHRRTHTGEKPFECDQCGKAFAQKGNLKVHKRSHTEEKPYSCDNCNKTYANKPSLNRHRRLHTCAQEILKMESLRKSIMASNSQTSLLFRSLLAKHTTDS